MSSGPERAARGARRPRRVGPLAERQFLLLFAGQSLSEVGNGIAPIALSFAVLDLTHSASDLGFVLAAQMLPLVAFLLIGGVWADRLPRRRVMLVADVVRAAAQLTIGVLLLSGSARLWQLVAAAVVNGTAMAFFQPAATGLTPTTVATEHLQAANGYLGMTWSFGATIGAAIGGALVAALGTGTAFIADAATFAWSAGFLALMRPRRGIVAEPQHFLRDLADGFREVISRSWLWTSILVIGVTMMTEVASFTVLGPVISRSHYGGAGAWAAMETGWGAGTILGNATALRVRFERPLLWPNLFFLLATASSVTLALYAPLPLIVAAQVGAGWSVGLFIAVWDTTIQEQIDPAALSRVSAYDWMGSLVFFPLGLALTGSVAGAIGAQATLLAGGALGAVLTILLACNPGVRNLRRGAPARGFPLAATGAEEG